MRDRDRYYVIFFIVEIKLLWVAIIGFLVENNTFDFTKCRPIHQEKGWGKLFIPNI